MSGDLRSPLARARGLGSAKEGIAHWWAQRATAIALVPLCLWFVASVVGLIGADRMEVAAWLSSPLSAALLVLTVAAAFHHAQLGLQAIVEDYVHNEGAKTAALLIVRGAALALGLAAILAILRLALKGAF